MWGNISQLHKYIYLVAEMLIVGLTTNAFITVEIFIHRVVFTQCGLSVPCLLTGNT